MLAQAELRAEYAGVLLGERPSAAAAIGRENVRRTRRARLLVTLTVPLLALLAVACERRAIDSDPELVVRAFIERMRSVHGDPVHAEAALKLVWARGRESLEERARRASAASGRTVKAEEMLVPSRFSLRFEPERFSTESRGAWSRVTVFGSQPGQLAEVPCVKEEGGWRVAIEFPALPPIELRDDVPGR